MTFRCFVSRSFLPVHRLQVVPDVPQLFPEFRPQIAQVRLHGRHPLLGRLLPGIEHKAPQGLQAGDGAGEVLCQGNKIPSPCLRAEKRGYPFVEYVPDVLLRIAVCFSIRAPLGINVMKGQTGCVSKGADVLYVVKGKRSVGLINKHCRRGTLL